MATTPLYANLGITPLVGIFLSMPLLAQTVPADSVRHRIILIGDAGRLRGGKNPVVDAVQSRYSFTDARNTLVYLGDNVYPRGLPGEADPNFQTSVETLQYQVRPGRSAGAVDLPRLGRPSRSDGPLDTYGVGKLGQVLFIPGNHDWAQGRADGWANIQRQGQWLANLNQPNIRMLPAGGCPGPEELLLTDKLVLVILDSQWWLHPYDKPGVESDCACKTEADVVAQLSDIARRHRDKIIVVATHHPFRSYGIHGGYYTLKQHIFPLTDTNPAIWVPLPVIGSLYPLVRGVFGNIQDLPNPTYRRMIHAIETALAPAPNVVFVSGHDHALQHLVDGSRQYIVSGSGINRERVKRGKLAKFVTSDWGYVVLESWTDGRLTTSFYTVDETTTVTNVYADTLFTMPTTPASATGWVLPQRPVQPVFTDSLRVAVAPGYNRAGGFHRWLLGNNYRTEWATPVTLPVFDLTRTNGGFTVMQQGGGMQTKSLRLRDSTGREWVLRSVQKDPGKALPAALRETIARPVLQDEISASHPYAALVVPPLAQAAGVPFTCPTLVYLPDDPALGDYRAEFGGAVYLFEARNPDGETSISTPKLLDALTDDNDNVVDERAVLRARMLDLLMGDWDRHEDQWRWGSHKTATGHTFYPIPRDRDQVFFRAEGVLPALAALPWIQPKFQPFGPRLSNVNGSMFNARFVDRLFLHGLSAGDWLTELTTLQAVMTDSVLQEAINQLPVAIRQQSGQQLLKTLKIRRGWLLTEGMTYYRFLAEAVDIPGSDKTELFQIDVPDDDHVAVSVFKISKHGETHQRLYHRVFEASVTQEIRLYGQNGNDRFEMRGPASSPIKIRLIGGKGDDVFSVSGTAEKPLIYDRTTEANALPQPGQARLRLSSTKAVNDYDAHAFQYDRLAPLVSAGYNLDDGVLLGAGVAWTKQGFRKTPFAAQNRLMIRRALATRATSIRYEGVFTDLIGKNDLVIDASIKAPNNVTNFFGVGNETDFDKSRGIRYYRTRYNLINVVTLLRRPIGSHLTLSAGPVFQQFSLDLSDNPGRFIVQYAANQPDTAPFLSGKSYGGLRAGFVLDTRDNALIPARGLVWTTTLLGLWGLRNGSNEVRQVQSDLRLHTRIDRAGRLVITNRLGGGLTADRPAFYQLLSLGGQDNLRGFRQYRFVGSQMLYYNLEARLKLFDFHSYLFPASVGLLVFNDVGRVWQPAERSSRWHDGYGGGLYMTPASLMLLTTSVAFSEEGALPYVSLGFRF